MKKTVKNIKTIARDARDISETQVNLLHSRTGHDRGAVSTEMALVMAGILGAAILLVVIFRNAASNAGATIPGA